MVSLGTTFEILLNFSNYRYLTPSLHSSQYCMLLYDLRGHQDFQSTSKDLPWYADDMPSSLFDNLMK